MITDKQEEYESIKQFLKNIDTKENAKQEDTKSIRNKTNNIKHHYKGRSDTKKYLMIHNHTLKHYPEIIHLRELYKEGVMYSEQQLQELAYKYIELCEMLDYNITLSWLCLFLGIHINSYQGATVNDIIQPLFEQKLLSSSNNSNLALLMKHRYNWKDKLTIETGATQQTKSVVEKIMQANKEGKSLGLTPPTTWG